MTEKSVSEAYESLFHYTGDRGLHGILLNKTLWATDYRFLNDSSELRLFLDAIKSSFNFSQGVTPEEKSKIFANLKEILLRHLEETDEYAPAYISCFCPAKKKGESTTEDNFEFQHGRLSQWRGYGKDGGYAIEFDTNIVEKMMNKEFAFTAPEAVYTCYLAGMSLSSMGYYVDGLAKIVSRDKETAGSITNQLIELASSVLDMGKKVEASEKLSTEYVNKHMSLVVVCASRIKHYGFHEENEVRIVAMASTQAHIDEIKIKNAKKVTEAKNVLFRPTDNAPYIELFQGDQFHELFLKSIRSVVIGPGSQQDRRKLKVKMMLRQYGYKNVEVRCSNIPLV